MFFSAIAAMLLMGSAPAEIRVDVGRIDLAGLPTVDLDRSLPTPAMVEQVEQILADGKCRLQGQSHARFDIDVPYAVLLHPDGSASRVVVSDMGCPEIESMTGLLVLELARQRGFGATGRAKAKWFGSKLNYNLQ